MRSEATAGLVVLGAALLGAVAQTFAAWGSGAPSLTAALALFAAGGWLLSRVDRRRREPLDEIEGPAPAARARRGLCATLLALAALFGVVASWNTSAEFSSPQMAGYAASLAAVLAAAVAADASRAAGGRRLAGTDVVALVLLTGLALGLRLWRLAEIPPILWEDEVYYLQDALRLLQEGWLSPFATGEWGAPYAHAYTIAASVSLSTDRTVALRMVSVVPGALAVPLLYLGLRDLFDRRFAIAGCMLLSISAWSVLQSRHGYVWAINVLAVAATIRWLARGLSRGRSLDFTLAGFGLGLGVLYSYAAALMPVVVGLFGLHLAVVRPKLLGARRTGCAFLVAGAVLVAAPRIVTFLANPETRDYQASAWIWSDGGEFPTAAVARQLFEIATAFNHRADAWAQFLPNANEPLLDPISATAFGLGLFWALFSWRRPGAVLLLLTFSVLLLPSALALAVTERATAWRACGVVPALFGLAGAPFAIAWDSLGGRLSHLFARTAIAGLLALSTLINLHAYFVRHPTKRQWFTSRSALHDRAARLVLAAPPGTRVLVAGDLEWPYVHALAAGVRDYETVVWPDGPSLPPSLGDDRATLVIARTRAYWEDDVSPGGMLIDFLQHYYPRGAREDVLAGDGLPLLATYALDGEGVRAAHGLDGSAVPTSLPSRSGTLLVAEEGEYRLSAGADATILVDERPFSSGFLSEGVHQIAFRGTPGSEITWSHGTAPLEPVPSELLLRAPLPRWGLRQRVLSPVQPWERWVPALWAAAGERRFELDPAAAVEWDGAFLVTEAGPHTLLVRSRRPVSLRVDGEATSTVESAWPEWSRFERDLASGWRSLWIQVEPPAEYQDLEAIVVGPDRGPRIVGGPLSRP